MGNTDNEKEPVIPVSNIEVDSGMVSHHIIFMVVVVMC